MQTLEITNMPHCKNLVFTSAGDKANVRGWCQGRRNFDLWITYYGKYRGRYGEIADFYNMRQGGKFPNFHYIYQEYPGLLAHYEAIMVMDDDIIIDAFDLSRLFEIRDEYDLWVLQPAFLPEGKVSHPITQAQKGTFLRYVDFVEVTCPLFKKTELDSFMRVYDPVLVGWGVDLWFLHVLGAGVNGKAAIIDGIPCLNPRDASKGGHREIDKLQPRHKRIAIWEGIKRRHRIHGPKRGTKEYGCVPAPLGDQHCHEFA